MNPHSDACFTSIEIIGPLAEFEDLERLSGPGHPYNAETVETLAYYDGPIVSIVVVAGDPRPRLDVLIDDDTKGDDGMRVHTEIRHNLVFHDERTLRATLHEGYVPTPQTYRLAEHIVRYKRSSTQIDHPCPRNVMTTAIVALEHLPKDELPTPFDPTGLPTPSNRERTIP